ncbi:outer membrane protein assembly factor BamE [Azospirillum picis]|uniref:Outer membrane protein assembly factor BamE (Lipoprotein component of BamABCDE complex) n=1 Tax=Azospirillum picis TaxID=488438 RepID=A0ABU0MEI7_9PROT|nr:outer membrane protein assembly factor BamE [Azospirillum picis]MBP2298013.1 outer membrane protein assembly factor BamE (lipoprotein component of BamABCDE complex) [Azospirillum picis]MDQ0531851.1 outer membrane protein assembly factor BamE (lipoprotein component of BamABCDE complex) [Azospirillum picis]
MTESNISAFRTALLGTALLAGLATAGCSPTVATRGNLTDPEMVAELQPGQSRRDDVAAVLGTPTSVGTFDPNVWYYIGQKTEKTAFFEPEVTERRVVVAHFDDNGILRQIKTLDKSNGQDIEMVERTTPTAGRELGFLEQMMGNVGRFSAKDTKGKSPGS